MKQVKAFQITAPGEPVRLPRGVPIEFVKAPAGAWWLWQELFLPGYDFDDDYEWPMWWFAVVPTGAPVSDGWQWLRSCWASGDAWHLYRVPDREMEKAGG